MGQAEQAKAMAAGTIPAANEGQPAQGVSQAKPAQSQLAAGIPRIEFKSIARDFGDIGPETSHTTQFEFKNAGTALLKVLRVKSCCGSVTRGVEPGQEYAPGESGALEVEYHTATYPGPLTRTLSIETNDPNRPVSNLTIKANVVRRIECRPNRMNLFPRKENAGCSPITLQSIDGKPFSIAGFRATANAITADFDPNVKATQFVLELKADVAKLPRDPKGQISIDLTHPECNKVLIPYDVLLEFSVTPAQLMLFNVRANQPIKRQISIQSNYNEDFDIDSVSSQQGAIKLLESRKVPGVAKVEGASGGTGNTGTRYQLQIEIMPPAQEDTRPVLSDVLEIKIKGGETLAVPCRAFYAAS